MSHDGSGFVMQAVIGGRAHGAFGRYVDYFRRIDGAWKVGYSRGRPRELLDGGAGPQRPSA